MPQFKSPSRIRSTPLREVKYTVLFGTFVTFLRSHVVRHKPRGRYWMSGPASREFQDRLTGFLSKMRIWALALTRNSSAADDLVQDVALKALMASKSFEPGTKSRPGYTGS